MRIGFLVHFLYILDMFNNSSLTDGKKIEIGFNRLRYRRHPSRSRWQAGLLAGWLVGDKQNVIGHT